MEVFWNSWVSSQISVRKFVLEACEQICDQIDVLLLATNVLHGKKAM